MSLNNIGVLMYGLVVMYIILYWILWFFKVPYYRKMMIHDNEPPQIICFSYFLLGTIMVGFELSIKYIKEDPNVPALTFWMYTAMTFFVMMYNIPSMVSNLRKKIPNRWEE